MARKRKNDQHQVLPSWLAKLGEEVAKKRIALNLKQDAFAERINISRDTLSAIENGNRSYGIEPLLQVFAGLETKPEHSLIEIASRLDPIDRDAADALGHLVGVLSGNDKEARSTAIRLVKSLRKDQIGERNAGKGRRHTT